MEEAAMAGEGGSMGCLCWPLSHFGIKAGSTFGQIAVLNTFGVANGNIASANQPLNMLESQMTKLIVEHQEGFLAI